MVKLYPSMLKVALLHFLKPSFLWLASVMARASGVRACACAQPPSAALSPQTRAGYELLTPAAGTQTWKLTSKAPSGAPVALPLPHLKPSAAATAGNWRVCVWLWAGPGCRAPPRSALWRLGEVGRPRGNGGDWSRASSKCVFSDNVESSPKTHQEMEKPTPQPSYAQVYSKQGSRAIATPTSSNRCPQN